MQCVAASPGPRRTGMWPWLHIQPYGVEKAVFSLDSGDKGICQWCLVKSSIVEN